MAQFPDNVQVTDGTGKVVLSLDEDLKSHVATVRAGGQGYNGELAFSDKTGHMRVSVNSDNGQIDIWRDPALGEELQPMKALGIQLSSAPSITLWVGGKRRIHLDAINGNIFLGGNGAKGDLFVYGDTVVDNTDGNKAAIRLDGGSGDIVLQNADCAEEFEVAEVAEPGSTMIVGEDGKLRQSREAYDGRVVGIVAGGGELRPGIILGRQPFSVSRLPVAMLGKVNCKVDATDEPIAVGDLLTTSPRAGYAMKASDSKRVFGTVLGKALGPQGRGLGLIPVLVALQ